MKYRTKYKRTFGVALAPFAIVAIVALGSMPSSASSIAAVHQVNKSAEASAAIPKETGRAKSSLSPVTIGMIGTFTGVGAPAPAALPAAQVAVKFINQHLGGIDGHPVKLLTCDTTGDEQQTRICAQQFANNKAVDLIVQGHGNEYSEDVYPIVEAAGLFVSNNDAYTTADGTTTDAVTYLAGATAVTAALAQFGVKDLHVKNFAILGLNVPVGQQAYNFVSGLAKSLGATAKGVLVNPTEADYTAPYEASGAPSADAVVALTADTQCVQLANINSQLGDKKPVLTTYSCWDPTVITGAGNKVAGWYVSYEVAPADVAKGSNPEVDFYNKVMKQYGEASQANGYAANAQFSQMIAIWNAARTAPSGDNPTSKSSWKSILTSYTGPVLMGPRSEHCPGPSTSPAICSFDTLVYKLSSKPVPTDPVTINVEKLLGG